MATEAAGRLARVGRASERGTLRQRVWAARWCYLFMAPNLLLAGMFTFYPAVASWYFSLLQWTGFSAERHFIGLDNYREVMRDAFFWDAFQRSFLFMFAVVPVQLGLALAIALVLNDRALKLAPVFRTMFFIPVVTTAAIVGIVMQFVLSPFNGPVNKALSGLDLIAAPIDFLGDPGIALWSVSGVYVWKWLGITMIYWLAALQVIPVELYEAARVDGAGRWRLHRDITVPLILPFAAIIALITAIGALNVFPLVQTMTGGGPFFATEVMEIYIYRTAFGTEGGIPRLGYASAAGVWFGICVTLVALMQGWAARKANATRRELTGGAR